MSTLVSPGVSVTVQNDSFSPASGSGSVPLVIFATAQDKLVPGSTTTVAEGTKLANAGKLYLMTSQRDALQTFGMPIFQENAGTVIQGDELNEYGLHAMFSALGITNRTYAIRADIDLNALQPTQVEPRNTPLNQTIWLDLANTNFGLFERQSTNFGNEILNWKAIKLLVPELTDLKQSDLSELSDTFGEVGDYAIVPYSYGSYEVDIDSFSSDPINTVYKKSLLNGWEVVNVIYKDLAPPIDGKTINDLDKPFPAGTVWCKLDSPAGGSQFKLNRYASGSWSSLNPVTGNTILEVEAKLGASLRIGDHGFIGAGDHGFIYRNGNKKNLLGGVEFSSFVGSNVILSYTIPSSNRVQKLEFAYTTEEDAIARINGTGLFFASVVGSTVDIWALNDRYFELKGGYEYASFSNWVPTKYFAQKTTPTRTAAENTLWYDDSLFADIMVNDGGRWRGLHSDEGSKVFGYALEGDKADIIFSQSEPVAKPEGGDLIYGDVWIDPQDGTNYQFYQYQNDDMKWMLLDDTDQSTSAGMLFADARSSNELGVSYFNALPSDAYDALMLSDYVDPTCPDPRLYPRGMLMLNLAQSGGVVRKYTENAFSKINFTNSNEYMVGDSQTYSSPLVLAVVNGYPLGRWVTASGVGLDGAGLFGRNAQRKMVVESMAAAIVSNDDLRSETIEFNIQVAPGYSELLDEQVTLNVDRRETSYIITDVPARLSPNATDVNAWAKNMNNAASNGNKGRTTRYDYAAQYMGWCLGTNVDGKEIAIPGSTVALRTYLYSDSVSYVWFPPAGTERGVVTNAASVGYISVEGEYNPVIYNQGQRDVMYLNNINPIAMRPNRGLLVFGDKSLSPDTTALDRVNVGRLVVYIRTEVEKIAERYLFKLNTPRTREDFAKSLTSFLSNIMLLEGLEDFAVVCDSSNNTADRRERNELWADIAIIPTKSINFIYVPIRIQNASN